MSHLLIAGLALWQGTVAAAEPAPSGDPLQSPPCRSALRALAAAESPVAPPGHAASADASAQAGAAPPHAPGPKLVEARRQAAAACLKGSADPPPSPQRLPQPPVAVSPVAPSRPPPLTAPAEARVPPAQAPAAAAPTAILSCDILGCWANDGSRLNRVGPNLWGSRGACTVQGTLLHCP